MVSSSKVHSDQDEFNKYLKEYKKEVDDLEKDWKGDSSTALMQKFNAFFDEYYDVINGQMTNFAEACESYVKYEECIRNLSNAYSYYSAASTDSEKSHWSSMMEQYEGEKRSLTNEINDYLSKITKRLTASNRFGVVNDAITWAVGIANDNSYIYATGGQGGGSYDCASLVSHAYTAAGVPLYGDDGYCWGVSGLRNAIDESGQFEKVYDGGGDGPDHTVLVTEDLLQPGDILYNGPVPEENWGHAAMYIGNGQCVAAHGYSYDVEDQINVYDYTPEYWNCVYRYKGDN